MRLVAFTEQVADLRVRFSVLHLDGSAMVWADGESASMAGKGGTLTSLALSMPGRNTAASTGAAAAAAAAVDPSTATVLVGDGAQASGELSAALTRRTGMPVYAHVRLPPAAEPLADTIALRLLRELRRTDAQL